MGVNITEEVGNIKSVTYNRSFNAAQAATVILPLNYICNDSEGGKFFGFKEVVYDEDLDLHKWVCMMLEPSNTAVTSLTANTPYLFMPEGATKAFPNIVSITSGVVTLQPTTANDGVYGGATTDDKWNIHGSYKRKTWTEPSDDYGFAAQNGTEADGAAPVEAGQFNPLHHRCLHQAHALLSIVRQHGGPSPGTRLDPRSRHRRPVPKHHRAPHQPYMRDYRHRHPRHQDGRGDI